MSTATPTPAPVDAAERVRRYLATVIGGRYISERSMARDMGEVRAELRGALMSLAASGVAEESETESSWWRLRAQPAPPPVATAPAVDLDAIAAALNAYHEASMDLGRACTASSARAEWCAANDARAEVDRLIAALAAKGAP